jgi:hypothetical protein
LCFEQAVEAFHLEQLSAEVAVEGFDERILPGCCRLDVADAGVVEAAPSRSDWLTNSGPLS